MAAGDCAINEGPPPQPLLLEWYCQRYNCLPEEGSLRDQSARDMELMSTLSMTHIAVSNWDRAQRSGNLGTWRANNPSSYRVVRQWLDMKRNE